MEEPNNDIDTETLQAQIDLAMAQAQNLITSWLPASGGLLTQSSSSRTAEAEAELQTLLRRPPRLGVGAPLLETHAPAQARLVQKLQGGKKRAWEKTANGAHTDAKKGDGEEESSAEESRIAGATTRKRTIIDPFSEPAGKKNGKRRRKEAVEETTDGTAQADRQTADERMTDAFGAMTAGPTPKKRKKKKKKSLLPEGRQGIVEHNGEPRSANTHNAPVAQTEGLLARSLPDTCEGEKSLRQEFRDGASEAPDAVVAAPGIGATSFTSSGQSLPGFPADMISAGNATHSFPPILNLAGPPSMAPEDTESHPRKKRRRRKKKKKPAGDSL